MLKKTLCRALLGAPLGLAMSYLITILVSIAVGGAYEPVVPALTAALGGELKAVILQAALSMLMGAGYGAASVIWEIERWSILRQSFCYFGLAVVFTLPTAYFCYWMEHTVAGVVSYLLIFIGVFIAVWLGQYFGLQAKIQRMNGAVERKK